MPAFVCKNLQKLQRARRPSRDTGMAVIREQDLAKTRADAFEQWQDAAHNIFSEQLPADDDTTFISG